MVGLSLLFFGKSFGWRVYASLLPLVGGIALLAATDLSASGVTLAAIAVSNVCFALRSLLAKPLFADKVLDNLNLFFHISWLSALATLPLWWATEKDVVLTLPMFGAAGLAGSLAANFGLHYAYNQFSFLILDLVSPLTHSIANAMRRFVIIVGSMMVFGLPWTWLNQLGICTPAGSRGGGRCPHCR